jgi:Resolvase, N terminal domain
VQCRFAKPAGIYRLTRHNWPAGHGRPSHRGAVGHRGDVQRAVKQATGLACSWLWAAKGTQPNGRWLRHDLLRDDLVGGRVRGRESGAMTAVLIYTRLSTEDVHDATVRQEVACRSNAEARNWEVAATLSDLDASAYQPRARRPGFERLIAEAARSADGVLVWKLDRLVRRPKDFERLWEVAERRGLFIASVTEPVDSSSPIGLAMLRILVALAGSSPQPRAFESGPPSVRQPRKAGHRRSRPTGSHCNGMASSRPRQPCCVKPLVGRLRVNGWRRWRVTCGHGVSRRRPGTCGRMRRWVGFYATRGWWATARTRGRLNRPGIPGGSVPWK